MPHSDFPSPDISQASAALHTRKHELIDELPAEEREAALLADQVQHDSWNDRSSNVAGVVNDFASDFQDDVLEPTGDELQNVLDEAQAGAEAVVEEIGRIPRNIQKIFGGAFDFLKGVGKVILALIIGVPILIIIIIILVLVRAARAARGKSAA